MNRPKPMPHVAGLASLRTVLCIVLCVVSIGVALAQSECKQTHKVAKKETIYGIAQQ